MSSMRNAVSRRPHKERSQPSARSKWGILEKHKDYSLRAQDYNTKKQKLAQLSRKVKEKHPDEFAYGMISKEKGRQGKHGMGGDENRLSHDAVKLLKTQDAGYLRTVLARNRKEVGRVSEELGGVEGRGGKVVFEEVVVGEARGKKRRSNGEVLQPVNSIAVAHVPTVGDQDMGVEPDEKEKNNQPNKLISKKTLLVKEDAASRLRAERKRRRRLQEVRTTRLEMLKGRQKEIIAVADQLELQRANMAKSIGGVNKNGVKFKIRERKK